MGLPPDIGGAQNAQTLGIGGHDAVLDPVMYHLDKVAGPVGPAVQVALFGSAADLLASRGGRYIAPAGSKRRKDRVEMLDDRLFAADHHAVTPLQPPDPAAGPDIDVMDPSRRQLLGAPDIVDVIGIAAVDQDVVGLESGQNVGNGLVDDGRGDHQPDRPRLLQLFDEVDERGGPDGVLFGQFGHGCGRHVEDHALMASLQQPPHHVGAHPAQADHSELHQLAPV